MEFGGEMGRRRATRAQEEAAHDKPPEDAHPALVKSVLQS